MLIFILSILLILPLVLLFTRLRWAEELAAASTGTATLLGFGFLLWPASSLSAPWYSSSGGLLVVVTGFISTIVQIYSLRHLDGHRFKRRLFRYYMGLTLALAGFMASSHLLLAVLSLGLSNLLLSRLIAHNKDWGASRASGLTAWRHLGTSSLLLLLAVALAWWQEGQVYQYELSSTWSAPLAQQLTLSLVIVAALLQSALFPFHRWLLASANAPTPVSAFMHAGLINGGALILYKFSPLLGAWSWPLLFMLGAVTAVLGTLWMLVQSDVKRTLTCSTMGQMGFMIMQCGMGLFPAAIAHIIWHGFFKASLFLSAGTTVKAASNYSLKLEGPFVLPTFVFGLITGSAGAYIFWLFTSSIGSLNSTYLLLLVFCGITCAHAAMSVLQTSVGIQRALLAAAISLFGASVYGLSVWSVEAQLPLMTAQPLQALHWAVLAFFSLGWVAMLFRAHWPQALAEPLNTWLYVRALRSSQPPATTLTLWRNTYQS